MTPNVPLLSSPPDRSRDLAGNAPIALVGDSDLARRARVSLDAAAARRTPALIVAPPGSRSLTIAAWLHARTRCGEPLLTVDCSALEAAELDDHLFGRIDTRRGSTDLETIGGRGALLAAAAGTLVLDNVDELPAAAQRRLARVLRDGEVRVASSGRAARVLARVVGCTTRDLEAEVRDGRFRQDLFRRLAASTIAVPALRERPADVAAMVDRLLDDGDAAPRHFTQPALTILSALPWPRNVDELATTLARVLESAPAEVRQEDVLANLPIGGAFARIDLTSSLRDARLRFEREYIAAVLEKHQWRMADAASALGIERANLYRKIRQLGLSRAPAGATGDH